jgi:hypothetical protein
LNIGRFVLPHIFRRFHSMNKTPDGMQKPDVQGVLRAERAGPGKWLKRTAGYAALAVILGWAG